MIAAAFSSFTSPEVFTNLRNGLIRTLTFGIFLIIAYVFIFVCGEFLAKGIILIRRWQLRGFFSIAVALIGLSGPGLAIYHRFKIYYADGNYLGAGLMVGTAGLIAAWLIFWFVALSLDVNEWTLEEKRRRNN